MSQWYENQKNKNEHEPHGAVKNNTSTRGKTNVGAQEVNNFDFLRKLLDYLWQVILRQ
jgi:hypothetical protein